MRKAANPTYTNQIPGVVLMKISTLSLIAVLAFFSLPQASYAMVCSYGGIKQLIKEGKFDEAKTSIEQCNENKSAALKSALADELAKARREAKLKEQAPKTEQ